MRLRELIIIIIMLFGLFAMVKIYFSMIQYYHNDVLHGEEK